MTPAAGTITNITSCVTQKIHIWLISIFLHCRWHHVTSIHKSGNKSRVTRRLNLFPPQFTRATQILTHSPPHLQKPCWLVGGDGLHPFPLVPLASFRKNKKGKFCSGTFEKTQFCQHHTTNTKIGSRLFAVKTPGTIKYGFHCGLVERQDSEWTVLPLA